MFKVKYNSDGTILKHKARLVAKGFHQTPGIDFEETFSPVVKAPTIRVLFTLAVTFGWDIQQVDVNNAFLNGDLHEAVFMVQPEGFVDDQFPTHVCKLRKSLYGLKQAPRAWYTKLRTALHSWVLLEQFRMLLCLLNGLISLSCMYWSMLMISWLPGLTNQ